MSPHALLITCTQSGVILKWDGSTIKACGEERIVSQWLPMLKTHKAELRAYFEAEAVGFYEERAAIGEFDGELSRADAEGQAVAELQTWHQNRTYH